MAGKALMAGDASENAPECMAGARFERILNDHALPGTEILQLFRSCFGAVETLWPANQRWLVWFAEKLVGHASVQPRWFVVNGNHFEGWFVGGVCIDPARQSRGLGTRLMRQVHMDLAPQTPDFAVLNCGEALVPFYDRLGYAKVADRALYLRSGQPEVDDDPALAISLKGSFDVAALACEVFPFGFEF